MEVAHYYGFDVFYGVTCCCDGSFKLLVSGELAVSSFGKNLELFFPRPVSRADVSKRKEVEREDVPLETLPNGKKSAPPIRTSCSGL
jgi:hypothetical protein